MLEFSSSAFVGRLGLVLCPCLFTSAVEDSLELGGKLLICDCVATIADNSSLRDAMQVKWESMSLLLRCSRVALCSRRRDAKFNLRHRCCALSPQSSTCSSTLHAMTVHTRCPKASQSLQFACLATSTSQSCATVAQLLLVQVVLKLPGCPRRRHLRSAVGHSYSDGGECLH